ncbi:MAG: transposase [Candidatus Sericytochromatia bacterium]|nr:transposase [Candidatus Tanganyikabacteria bacterium]
MGGKPIALRKRLAGHLDGYFNWYRFPGVPPDNSLAERAARSSVVERKVSGGNRSKWGAERAGSKGAPGCPGDRQHLTEHAGPFNWRPECLPRPGKITTSPGLLDRCRACTTSPIEPLGEQLLRLEPVTSS